jgi:purine-binding chemotaxis protein CheW
MATPETLSRTAVASQHQSEMAAQYLTFVVGDEVFAMEISSVREIIQYGAMTTVPLMPDFVRGVINLRGSVVPVIDMKSRFGWSRSELGKKTCIIIFDLTHSDERVEIGLLVDSVSEVVDILVSEVAPPPQFGATIKQEYIHGMGKIDDNFVIILAPHRALDIEEMSKLTAQIH